ncbi:hypothetical protein [Actinomadura sp. 7K507]|uniref:hypothetical protein n=1 Tax=Actinomadura sp. 7K507 TaxID=2530365 RepID=UPI001047B0B2|nr:hypothetical protein [Actinomadura sp. 7K507]TDC90348.1 hypothetical protein E1285_14970 [Actinomadura sp. 7K507]
MSDESRPTFEPPDQRLDGADRTAGEPPADPPEPADLPVPVTETAKSRWPRITRRRWALVSGAVALAAASGAAWALGGHDGGSAPARFTSIPEPCLLVPGYTLERHVPNSDAPVPAKAATSATERYGACEWAEPSLGPPGAKTLTAHRLNVAVRLHLGGATQAESEFDAAWNGARSMAGKSQGAGGSLHAEAPSVIGIGDRAFTHYSTLKGPLGRSGTATVTVRLDNAVISVRYRGTTSELGKDGSPKAGASKAPDEEATRADAETIAKSVTDTLATCADCVGP